MALSISNITAPNVEAFEKIKAAFEDVVAMTQTLNNEPITVNVCSAQIVNGIEITPNCKEIKSLRVQKLPPDAWVDAELENKVIWIRTPKTVCKINLVPEKR